MKQSGTFLYHTNCVSCGSSDGLALYEQEDGHIDGTCFVCHKYYNNPMGEDIEEKKPEPQKQKPMISPREVR